MKFPDDRQIAEDLKNLRDDNSVIVLTFNPSTVWVLIIQLQIALRCYSTSKEFAEEILEVAKEMQKSLDEHPLYTECLRQILDSGWNGCDNSVNNLIQQLNNN